MGKVGEVHIAEREKRCSVCKAVGDHGLEGQQLEAMLLDPLRDRKAIADHFNGLWGLEDPDEEDPEKWEWKEGWPCLNWRNFNRHVEAHMPNPAQMLMEARRKNIAGDTPMLDKAVLDMLAVNSVLMNQGANKVARGEIGVESLGDLHRVQDQTFKILGGEQVVIDMGGAAVTVGMPPEVFMAALQIMMKFLPPQLPHHQHDHSTQPVQLFVSGHQHSFYSEEILPHQAPYGIPLYAEEE